MRSGHTLMMMTAYDVTTTFIQHTVEKKKNSIDMKNKLVERGKL